MRRKWIALITLFLLTTLIGAAGLWLRAQPRQLALNRALIAALMKGDNAQALALVQAGADPNTRYTSTLLPSSPWEQIKWLFHRPPLPANDGLTAFLIACGAYPISHNYPKPYLDMYSIQSERSDDAFLVKVMLEHGANIDARVDKTITALSWATYFQRTNTVRMLLEHGAQVDCRDEFGHTPLIVAARRNQVGLIRLFLDYKADVNARDKLGMTPLHQAVYANRGLQIPSEDPIVGGVYVDHNSNSVRLLLAHGANVNAQDDGGITPLEWAMYCMAEDNVIVLLLEHGADPDLPDKIGETPLKVAQQRNPQAVALLKKYRWKK